MSYRALLTITDGTSVFNFVHQLDEDLRSGEEAAHHIAYANAFVAGLKVASQVGVNKRFETAEARKDWIDVYADQTWTITFTKSGDFTEVVIRAVEADDKEFFMRRINFHTPD